MDYLKEQYTKHKEVILYIFFGGCTTVINMVVYFFCTRIFMMDEMVANVWAWLLAVVFAFLTNKLFVFESKTMDVKTLIKEVPSFIGARLFSLGVDMAIMYVGIKMLFVSDTIVKLFTQVAVVIINYLFSKFIIFKEK